VVAEVEFDRCSGCSLCVESCPVGAIAPLPHTGRMTVDPARCKGCGACAAVCPNSAAALRHYRAKQLLAELEAASS